MTSKTPRGEKGVRLPKSFGKMSFQEMMKDEKPKKKRGERVVTVKAFAIFQGDNIINVRGNYGSMWVYGRKVAAQKDIWQLAEKKGMIFPVTISYKLPASSKTKKK